MRRFTFGVVALAAVVLAVPSAVRAQGRSVQVAPDGKLMVNKTLGGEQWSIVVDFSTQTMAGNVTNLDGSDPQFIWCTILSPVVTEPEDFLETESVELACSGADGCSGFPCSPSAWTNLGSFEVQSSFFVPTAAAQSCNRVGPPECAGVCNTFPSSSCVAIGETCSCVMFPQASPTP
jgi:hypothetical protein